MRRGIVATFLLLVLLGVNASHTVYGRVPGFDVEDEIWPSPGADGGAFGTSVATDGIRLAVGAPGESAVYLYTRIARDWVQETRLVGPANTGFGMSVAIEGDQLYVGAPLADDGPLAADVGQVEVYRRDSNAWRHDSTWVCPDARRNMHCGAALVAEGGRLFVGAPGDDLIQDLQPGLVYQLGTVGGLTVQHRHEEPDAQGLQFGAAIAFDDDQILVGAPARTSTESVVPGSVFFYDRHGSNWLPRGSIEADVSIGAAQTFGQNVAIDGKDALITTIPIGEDGSFYGGDAFFYNRQADKWVLLDEVWGLELAAIAMHNSTALMASWWDDTINVYKKVGFGSSTYWSVYGFLGGWSFSQRAEGYGFALTYHDRVVAVGAPEATKAGTSSGAAFAYYDNNLPWAYAGRDQRVNDFDGDGSEPVHLVGWGYDQDGTIVAYRWYQAGELIANGEEATIVLPLGEHTILLEVEDDLGATATDALIVRVRTPVTEAQFTWSPNFPWPGSYVRFQDESQDLRSPIKEWSWDFDEDGFTDNTQQEPYHRWSLGGPHDVSLTTRNMEGDTLRATQTIEVQNSDPIAFGGWSRMVPLDDTGLSATTTLDGSGSVDDGQITSYEWDVWETNSISVRNGYQGERVEDVALAPGPNTVSLQVRDNENRRDTQIFTILAAPGGANATATDRPTASFSASQYWERTYRLQDTSQTSSSNDDIVIWLWDTDNNGIYDAEGPRLSYHEFDGPGEHQVRLTIWDERGVTETTTQTINVPNSPPRASFWPNYLTLPEGSYMVFRGPTTDADGDIADWQWTFGNGLTSDHTDVGNLFKDIGRVDISLTVTDDGGLTDTQTGHVEVVSLAQWEAWYGDYVEEELLNATAENPPEAFGATPKRTNTPTYTYAKEPPAQEVQADESPDELPNEKFLGIPLWIFALLALILVAIAMIAWPIMRQK